ncbi:DoxX family protein, partial [Mycolicibacterium chitae]|nr:DoxX family protein [Mycolicibacterium chitae]
AETARDRGGELAHAARQQGEEAAAEARKRARARRRG